MSLQTEEKISSRMEKNVHPIIAWSAILVLFVAVIFMFFQFNNLSNQFAGINHGKEVVVALDYGNGKIRRFKGPAEENARVWDLFQQAIAVGGINVAVSDHFVPQVIDGLKDGAGGKHWNLYVNNIKQEFSPFEIQVKPGDEVVFRFE